MTSIQVIREGERTWRSLVDPPGAIPSEGADADAFTSPGGSFTTGFWRREPDTWSFERPYHEVALILAGRATIETDDGEIVRIEAGDVLITPRGSRGTWHITETIVKFYAIASEVDTGS
jgi:uncharacterized cupin superfamily protein